jgi:hypothetical protein
VHTHHNRSHALSTITTTFKQANWTEHAQTTATVVWAIDKFFCFCFVLID